MNDTQWLIRFKFCICPNLFILLVSFSILSGVISCDKVEAPSLKTLEISGLTDISALGGGNILSNGGEIIFEKGICWKKGYEPFIEDNLIINSEDSLSFKSLITGLEPGTTYCVKAFAKNKVGVGYGDPVYFTTYPRIPLISDVIFDSITASSAKIKGYFNIGTGVTLIATGVCYSSSPHPDLSDLILERQAISDTLNITLSPLQENSVYYVRLYIIVRLNSTLKDYLFYGNESSFKTKITEPIVITPPEPVIPSVLTETISSITTSKAGISGVVSDNGGSPILQRGICLGTSTQPTISNTVILSPGDTGRFHIEFNNLKPMTIYYARAFASNIAGISYGAEIQFQTYGTVADIQGNIYTTIQLGNQIWIRENLKVTLLNDGTEIKRVDDVVTWFFLSEPVYCWYNKVDLDTVYGPLYNWLAVNTNKLCPSGWHVPSWNDWMSLIDYFGGVAYRMSTTATKMKNEVTGFAPLYGGELSNNNFVGRNDIAKWWSSTPDPGGSISHALGLSRTNGIYFQLNQWCDGLSVRCVKDTP
jgi:uncharacterized protein (TIGR02145 family)